MTKDPKQFLAIAHVCATLSKAAATPEERQKFAELATKWRRFAAEVETLVTRIDKRPTVDDEREEPSVG
jgi:hypothetical protein